MTIAIGCHEFQDASGMPMFVYRIARELVGKHSVYVFANVIGGVMEQKAKEAGIPCGKYSDFLKTGMYPDVLWLNENTVDYAMRDFLVPTFYLIHSQYAVDAPIPNTILLVARAELNEYYKLRVPVIPIPIPFAEFPPKTIEHEGYHILCPSTIDEIRVPMIRNLIERAKGDTTVKIVGAAHMDVSWLDKYRERPNLIIHTRPFKSAFEEMCWADEVAGIFEGTVTLEAWAMKKKTSVYDMNGNYVMKEPPKDFRVLHDSKRVAQLLLDMFCARTQLNPSSEPRL